MLVLITLLVTGAMTLSTSGLKSVANSQFRDEAVAAGNQAIERMLNGDFTTAPQPQGYNIDMENDGDADYAVNFQTPVCLNGSQVATAEIPPSSISLGAAFNVTIVPYYRTLWELTGTVSDPSGNGAAVTIRQGVTVLVNQTVFNTYCQGGIPP